MHISFVASECTICILIFKESWTTKSPRQIVPILVPPTPMWAFVSRPDQKSNPNTQLTLKYPVDFLFQIRIEIQLADITKPQPNKIEPQHGFNCLRLPVNRMDSYLCRNLYPVFDSIIL